MKVRILKSVASRVWGSPPIGSVVDMPDGDAVGLMAAGIVSLDEPAPEIEPTEKPDLKSGKKGGRK